ncbi:hypothetical protein LTR37_012215 [Vermiconidia calcicola]|uniref:Uncharacterized protein n=1 Tax=Vermiconidia calcicola TaxID=1690605 RepID=A0ACC3N061_9PEZI|nr:hypothetical protein LTR37_012215 [Vermiconidia calcicola]
MYLSTDLQNPFGERLYEGQLTGLWRAELIIYAFVGGLISFSIQDTGSHLSEEYHSARTKLPAGILIGHAINGVLGLFTLLALMAATPSLDVIAKAPFGQAHLYLCLAMSSTDIPPVAKADTVGIAISVMLLTAGSFGLATASRCIFAGARLGLFPQSANRILALTYGSKPWPSIIVAAMASCIWALFTFSPYAFTIIAALSTLGLWCSFILTFITVLRYKRSSKALPGDGAKFPHFFNLHIRSWICWLAITCAIPLFLILCLPATLDPATIDAQSFPWAPMVFLVIVMLASLNYHFGFHNYHPDQIGAKIRTTKVEQTGRTVLEDRYKLTGRWNDLNAESNLRRATGKFRR